MNLFLTSLKINLPFKRIYTVTKNRFNSSINILESVRAKKYCPPSFTHLIMLKKIYIPFVFLLLDIKNEYSLSCCI